MPTTINNAAYVYVKFMRGTQTAYDALPTKEADTLYFIYGQDEKYGKLYIGERLITTSGTSSEAVATTLGQLTDVDVSGVLNSQVLGYDADLQIWKPMTINEAVEVSVMIGATAEQDGVAGLVPAPVAGGQNKYLRGDGTWASIPDMTGLKRTKVNSTDDINLEAADAEQYIYMVPIEGATEGNLYNEFMVIDGVLEMVGTSDINLDDYLTKSDFETEKATLNSSIGSVETKVNDIASELNDYVAVADYETKIAAIEGDISSLKYNTSWHELT